MSPRMHESCRSCCCIGAGIAVTNHIITVAIASSVVMVVMTG